jgi:outer membrane protein OmpA-like peptidoglycan-associated protein
MKQVIQTTGVSQVVRSARSGTRRTEQPGSGWRRSWLLPLGLAGLFLSAPAAAQTTDGEFSVQRFDPAPGPRNYFSTRGARVEGQMAWSAGLVANYAADPFVVVSCKTQADCAAASAVAGRTGNVHIVDKVITGDVLGSLTPIDRLQLGLKVPISFVHGDGLGPTGLAVPGGLSGAGLGDLMLEAKLRAYGEVKDTFVIGVSAFGTAPLGHATAKDHYIGDGSPIVGLRGIFDGKDGPWSFGGNLAGLYRSPGRVGSTTIGSEFRYGVGAGFEASPVVRIILDGFGGTKFSSKNGTNSLEVDGGGIITPLGSPIAVLVGGGAGAIEGVGVPTFRAILGVMYTSEAKDRDGDGINDNQDQCPTEPEDKDGYEDADGCPDRDNDGDTIQDKDDKCPNQAEDPDGFQDTDGCPDPDNDADGVDDAHDQCPDKKETKNGFKDDDGCPDEPDKDGDGVADAKDKCPDQAEDTDGFEDTDGCPDPDNDGDGINDEDDECVDEPETKNGFKDEDGCPDSAPAAKAPAAEPEPKVELKKDRIEVPPVAFAKNKDTILKESFSLLEQVVVILKKNAWVKKVRVGGHTDDRGGAAANMKLSERRAASVQKYLTDKGIAADRLEYQGFGQTVPVADNKTEEGRAKNRRVEFIITDPPNGEH